MIPEYKNILLLFSELKEYNLEIMFFILLFLLPIAYVLILENIKRFAINVCHTEIQFIIYLSYSYLIFTNAKSIKNGIWNLAKEAFFARTTTIQ